MLKMGRGGVKNSDGWMVCSYVTPSDMITRDPLVVFRDILFYLLVFFSRGGWRFILVRVAGGR